MRHCCDQTEPVLDGSFQGASVTRHRHMEKQQAEQSDSPGQTSWPKRCKIIYGSEQFEIARHLTSVSPLRKFEVDFLIVRQTRQA